MKFLVFILSAFLVSCNGGKNQTNIENVSNMMDQHALKPQGYSTLQGKPAVRKPPAGTVARNIKYYEYKGDLVGAESNLKNPYAGNFSEEIIREGRNYYRIYCSVCHGETGDGKGTVSDKMGIIKPPSLITDTVKGHNDGRLFHIITDGQGLMGPYNTQIYKEKHRWAIVQYIRELQKGRK